MAAVLAAQSRTIVRAPGARFTLADAAPAGPGTRSVRKRRAVARRRSRGAGRTPASPLFLLAHAQVYRARGLVVDGFDRDQIELLSYPHEATQTGLDKACHSAAVIREDVLHVSQAPVVGVQDPQPAKLVMRGAGCSCLRSLTRFMATSFHAALQLLVPHNSHTQTLLRRWGHPAVVYGVTRAPGSSTISPTRSPEDPCSYRARTSPSARSCGTATSRPPLVCGS
jgi:hypothetical protein